MLSKKNQYNHIINSYCLLMIVKHTSDEKVPKESFFAVSFIVFHGISSDNYLKIWTCIVRGRTSKLAAKTFTRFFEDVMHSISRQLRSHVGAVVRLSPARDHGLEKMEPDYGVAFCFSYKRFEFA